MNQHSEEMRRELDKIFDSFPHIHTTDIPGIDLYMDQVTTFLQENLRGLSRDPEDDKFLTKTMINNYVKNKVLIPPVKKKYSREHMMLLIMIYYMKSFLSIGDIRTIITPIMERYADFPLDPKKDAAERKREQAERRREQEKGKDADRKKKSQITEKGSSAESSESGDLRIYNIYEEIFNEIEKQLPEIQADIERSIDFSEDAFMDAPEEDRPVLQRFALICRLSAEVYMRKLFIEKLLDEVSGGRFL